MCGELLEKLCSDMANLWFKFYAADYLKEVKFLGVDANKRSCFLTLLCYAAGNDGKVDTRYLTEDILRIEAGIPMGGEAWDGTTGFYQWLVDREIGTLNGYIFEFITWSNRQESYLTPAERVKKHREKKHEENVTTNVTDVTLEKRRIEKNREEKNTASLSYLSEIPPEDLKEMSEKYEASTSQIKRKAETMKNYCLSKGKIYKNYRAFLENGLDKDFGRRKVEPIKFQPEKIPMTAEEKDALARIGAEVKEIGTSKRVH